MRNILSTAVFILVSAIPAFSTDSKTYESSERISEWVRLAPPATQIAKTVQDLQARVEMCNYFRHVYNDGKDFEDKIMDLHSSKEFINYEQCCPLTGSSPFSVLSESLAAIDPLPHGPEARLLQIKRTEAILHDVYHESDFAPLMEDVTHQIEQTSKEVDRVSCAPLAATYGIIKRIPSK